MKNYTTDDWRLICVPIRLIINIVHEINIPDCSPSWKTACENFHKQRCSFRPADVHASEKQALHYSTSSQGCVKADEQVHQHCSPKKLKLKIVTDVFYFLGEVTDLS